MRVAGLIHKVVRDLEGDFQGRYIASGNPATKGLSADDLKEALYSSVMDWTDPVTNSVKDVDPLEANLDPNDAPEFRAQDKRAIRADKFTDDALRVYAGIQKTPPAPPAANVIDVPVAVSFYVAVNGEPKGPFTGLELSAMATKGELVGTSMVYDAERGDNWVEAASVPALAGLFGRRSQPRTPPPPPKTNSGQGKAS